MRGKKTIPDKVPEDMEAMCRRVWDDIQERLGKTYMLINGKFNHDEETITVKMCYKENCKLWNDMVDALNKRPFTIGSSDPQSEEKKDE